MSNVIAYSLFGYQHENANCFDFKSYLRYLGINLRMRELIWPEWRVYLAVDEHTYNSPYKDYFDYLSPKIDIEIVPLQPLCVSMLYRMKPIFKFGGDGVQYADRVICRDIDSLSVYRERQAVQYWINNGRVAHAITDSISHTIPLMGGMVGFMSQQLRERLGVSTFEQMLEKGRGIDYSRKGADQDFLNRVILPVVISSITEHYILGMPLTSHGDSHAHIQPAAIPIGADLVETNYLVNHIGQSGCAIEPVLKDTLNKYLNHEENRYFDEIEKKYSHVFYWQDES